MGLIRLLSLAASFSILSILFILLDHSAQAARIVPIQMLFSIPVHSPSHVSACHGSLWIYSVGDHLIQAFDPKTGKLKQQLSLASLVVSGSITAMGCREDALIVATQEKDQASKRIFFSYKIQITNPEAHEITIPGRGLIQEITCRAKTCYVLRGELFKSNDLATWSKIRLPDFKEANPTDLNLKENPFSHWSDRFLLAKSQYFRVLPLPANNEIMLLDPVRASVVIHSPNPIRWGEWGVWEGRMMFPKGMAVTSSGTVLISDVGLRIIYMFSRNGKYIGTLGNDKTFLQLHYPMALEIIDGTLFVADFKANKVFAIGLPENTGPQTKVSVTQDDLARRNLFRRPDIIRDRSEVRCLSCHDGSRVYSLEKFVSHKTFHPVHVELKPELKGKVDLPLQDGKLVTCSTCHNPHHPPRPPGVKIGQFGEQIPIEKSAMLRRPERALCATCHPRNSTLGKSHIDMEMKKGATTIKLLTCSQCHLVHSGGNHLLKLDFVNLCSHCHGEKQRPGNHPITDKVWCVSCHSPHGSHRDFKFASGAGSPSQTTCLKCHTKIKDMAQQTKHLTLVKVKPHSWPAPEAVCVECHYPHQSRKVREQLCISCHELRRQEHKQLITVADTKRAENIRLLERDKIFCLTCHELHGPPKDKATIMPFCSSCHGQDTEHLFNNYHPRLGFKGI